MDLSSTAEEPRPRPSPKPRIARTRQFTSKSLLHPSTAPTTIPITNFYDEPTRPQQTQVDTSTAQFNPPSDVIPTPEPKSLKRGRPRKSPPPYDRSQPKLTSFLLDPPKPELLPAISNLLSPETISLLHQGVQDQTSEDSSYEDPPQLSTTPTQPTTTTSNPPP